MLKTQRQTKKATPALFDLAPIANMLHKATPLLRIILTALVFASGSAHAKRVAGVPLPRKAVQLAKSEFRSPYSLRGSVRWLEKALTRRGRVVRFEQIVDLPDVVAFHAESPSRASKWSGVNVSEYNGSVKIFIIVKQP